MPRFLAAHATHPDAGMALALAAAQIEAQRAQIDARARPAFVPTLGWLYFTDVLAPQAEALCAELHQRWPGVAWVGGVGVGIVATGVEYLDEPALALMLTDLPADQFSLFDGRRPLGSGAAHFTAQVHVDPTVPDVAELIAELAERTDSGYLFGGLVSSRGRTVHLADQLHQGGLSGVAFGPEVSLRSRVTQGSQPVGPSRRITACDGNVVLALDDQAALPLLLGDLGLSLDRPQQALQGLRRTLVGLTDGVADSPVRPGQFGAETRVRHLIGIDPGREAIAIADVPEPGQQLAFCRRDAEAARRDLIRICAELREEAEGADQRIAGALYISCSGRGGPHFGGPSAEARIVQHALGEVPLVGFFAAGEVARDQLYGYTGVLTVFIRSARE